jgi:hypothetical protein
MRVRLLTPLSKTLKNQRREHKLGEHRLNAAEQIELDLLNDKSHITQVSGIRGG